MDYFVHCKICIMQIFENKDYTYNSKFKIRSNIFNRKNKTSFENTIKNNSKNEKYFIIKINVNIIIPYYIKISILKLHYNNLIIRPKSMFSFHFDHKR